MWWGWGGGGAHLVYEIALGAGRDVELVILVSDDLYVADVSHHLSPGCRTTAIGEHHICEEKKDSSIVGTYSTRSQIYKPVPTSLHGLKK